MSLMTKEQATDRYGEIILQTSAVVVRGKTHEDGSVSLFLHRIEGGAECLPLGYVTGHNTVRRFK